MSQIGNEQILAEMNSAGIANASSIDIVDYYEIDYIISIWIILDDGGLTN